MKSLKIFTLLFIVILLSSCASGYKMINPKNLNYLSKNENEGIVFEYKYNLLNKKYAKNEIKKGIKLVAIKLTNNSDNDLIFGKDLKLVYTNGSDVMLLDHEMMYTFLKQSPASYLWYLLLTPVNFYTTETNSNGFQEETSSTPIGLVLGPGLAGGNMIAASSANKKLKTELLEYNIHGRLIKKGETAYGLVGLRSNQYDAIKIKLE